MCKSQHSFFPLEFSTCDQPSYHHHHMSDHFYCRYGDCTVYIHLLQVGVLVFLSSGIIGKSGNRQHFEGKGSKVAPPNSRSQIGDS